MADAQANIQLGIDTSQALANLKALQSQISAFQTSMAKGSATQAANAAKIRQNLMNDINATNKFAASIANIKTTTESFTESLEKNKFSMGQYFRYAGGASKSFGKLFKSEMSTIEKVARERVKSLQTQYIQMGRDANGAMKAIAVRPLMLDMDNLATKTAIAAQKQQILNQLLRQGSTNLLNFGKNTQWAGRQLMVGFTVPLTMAGSAAAKTYMEMEKAIVKFKRVYGDLNTTGAETAKTLSDLKQLANEFTKYGVAVSDTMDMAAQAAATGKMGADLIAQVQQATKLAVLGNVEQSQALETTISLTNAFGTAAEQLAGKIDFLNAVENQTVTSIEDLTIAIPKAAPVIQQLGGDVEDLAFFLTAMKEGGINASEGANALKSGLASMINPTKKASEFLQGFGINLKGIVEGNKGNVKNTVVEVARAFDTLDPLNRARAIEQLFGKFQFARISTLFQNVIKEGSQAQTVLGLTKNTAEELAVLSERELNKISESPMYKFQKTLEDIKTKIVPIGEAFLKMITPIIEWAGTLIDNFNKMGAGVKDFWLKIIAGVVGLGPVILMAVGLISNGVANLIKLFTNIKSWFNRTTDSTTILGEQTAYMTQEQLDAAAVAASLDQAHSTLIQTFTSEATAIDQLRTAYEKATAAQMQFSNANVIPTAVVAAPAPTVAPTPTTGYANGTFMVPGPKGAGDIVPAMLTPGEAVIPADKAKKYGGLINGIIAGNIPGFSKGRRSPSDIMAEEIISPQIVQQVKDASNKIGETPKAIQSVFDWFLQELDVIHSRTDNKSGTVMGNTEEQVQQKLLAWMQGIVDQKVTVATKAELAKVYRQPEGTAVHKMYSGMAGKKQEKEFAHLDSGLSMRAADVLKTVTITAERMARNIADVAKVFPDMKADIKTGFGIGLKGTLNNSMKEASGITPDEFLADYKTRDLANAEGTGKWNDLLNITGTNFEQIKPQLEAYDAELLRLVEEQKAAGRSIVVDSIDQVKAAKAKAEQSGESFNESDYIVIEDLAKQAQENIKTVATDIYDVLQEARDTVTEVRIQLSEKQRQVLEEVYGRKFYQSQGGGANKYRGEGGAGSGIESQAAKDAAASFSASTGQKDFNDQAQTTADTHSESKRTKQIAKDTVDGFINEIARSKDKISGTAKELADGIATGFSSRLSQIGDGMVGLPDPADVQKLTKKSKVIIADAIKNQGDILAGVKGKVMVVARGFDEAATAAEAAADSTSAQTDATEVNTEATDKNTTATDKNTESKENGSESGNAAGPSAMKRFFSDTKGTRNFKKGFGGVAAAVGMASMVPGAIGETAQAIMGPISAATAAMSMIPGPAGLVAGGLALVGTTAMAVADMLDKNRKKAYEMESNLVAGGKAIAKYAEFAKKVTATEIMDKRRQSQMGVFNYAPGKKSFGTSFAESDAGKEMLTALADRIKIGGMDAAATLLTNQLMSAVTSGALTAAQARSVSAALGTSLGDQTFAMKVTGDLLKLTGPNGENLEKDPLQVRLDILSNTKDQIDQTKQAFDDLRAQQGTGVGLWGQWDAGSNGWDTTLDFVTLGISAAVRAQDNIGKAAAMWQAQAAALLETGQQQIDSLDLEYEKRIKNLTAAGKLAEAEELTNKHLADRQTLMQAVGSGYDAVISAVDTADNGFLGLGWFNTGTQNKQSDTANDAITKAYEGTQMAPIAELVRQQIDAAGGTKGQQVALKSLVGSKQLGLTQAQYAVKNFSGTEGMNQLQSLFSGVGDIGAVNQALEMAAQFKDLAAGKQFILDIETRVKQNGPMGAKEFIDAMALVKKSGVVTNPQIILEYFQKNPAKALEIKNEIDKIKKEPEITQDIIVQYLGQDAMDAVKTDQKYFNSLNKDNKLIYLTTVETELALQTDPAWLADKAIYEKEIGKTISNVAYAAHLANLETEASQDVNVPGDLGGNTGGGGSGPTASWLDEIVKKTRDLFDANQQLTIGYKASGDALAAFYKKGKMALTGMAGLQMKLANAGLGRDIISNILGMPKEEADKWMKMFFKGGSVTEFAKNVNAIMYANKAGDYIAETQLLTNDYLDQTKALSVLTAAGTEQAVTQTLLNDENMRSIIYGTTLSGKIADQVAKTKELTKAYIRQLAIERLRKDPRQAIIDSANIKIETIQKQNAVWQNGLDIISKQEDKISSVYDKQIAALNEVKSVNEQISRQKQGELDLADALSKGDIGAAAKAAESIRAQRAQDAVDNQIKALEDAKKRAIDSISVEIGGKKYTKLELTNKIGEAELDILKIQKDQVVQQEAAIAKDKERLDYLAKIKAEEIAIIKAKESKLKNNKVGNGKSGASGIGGSGSGGLGGGITPTPPPTTAPPASPTVPTSTGAGANALDASFAIGKSANVKNLAQRFGGQQRLDAAMSGVSIFETQRKKIGLENKISDMQTALLAYKKGSNTFASDKDTKFMEDVVVNGKTVHQWVDRSKIPASERANYDKAKNLWNSLQGQLKTVESDDQRRRDEFMASLPQELQTALYILKSRQTDRKPLADKEKQAKAAYNKTIGSQLGFDSNGRPNVTSDADRKIADAAWSKYMSNGGMDLSLFDSRVAQLERSLNSAGISKQKIEGLIGKYATGGHVTGPGTGTSDSIPAMLSDGEFVVKASTVDKVGVHALNHLNQTGSIARFAGGGSVGYRKPTASQILNMQADVAEIAEKEALLKNWKNNFWSDVSGHLLHPDGKGVYDYAISKLRQNIAAFNTIYGTKDSKGRAYANLKIKSPLGNECYSMRGLKSEQLRDLADTMRTIKQYEVLANDDSINMEAARIISSFTPVVGTASALAGTGSALAKGDLKSAGVSSLGAFGGVGGTLRVGSKALNAVSGLQKTTTAITKADTAFGKFNNAVGTYANAAGTSEGYIESWLTKGKLPKFHMGGLIPGGFETPIMAKGGEFVMSDYAVKQFGVDTMNAMNSGSATSIGDSVYNYSVNVNVSSNSNPNEIARTVISQIRQIDSQRIRSNTF